MEEKKFTTVYDCDEVYDEGFEARQEKRNREYNDGCFQGVGVWGRRAIRYIYSDEPLWIMACTLDEGGAPAVNAYAKLIDKKADELWDKLDAELRTRPEYKMPADRNWQKIYNIECEIRDICESEIYKQLIYVDDLITE